MSDKRFMDKDDEMILKNFTAKDAQVLAKSHLESETRDKLNRQRGECYEKIKTAINNRERECTFTLRSDAEGASTSFSDAGVSGKAALHFVGLVSSIKGVFFDHFKKDLNYLIICTSEDTFSIRWDTDKTRRFSDGELAILATQQTDMLIKNHKAKTPDQVFSVYHAMLLQREVRQKFIKDCLDKLVVTCIRKIQSSIERHESSFLYIIPYADLNIDVDDRLTIFDMLVAELKHRQFNITEQRKAMGQFRLHCLPATEVTIEVDNHGEDHLDIKGYGIDLVPQIRENAIEAIQNFYNLVVQRMNILQSVKEKGSIDYTKQVKLNAIDDTLRKITGNVVSIYPEEL